ncbi:UrcA family protein [Sphingomonas sp. MMS24-J45]|uniref:UrcA family protein n=1 Tax=Sphingomonas sp. MMS24-J45 TaxID=3238806 RepID=UPI00384D83E7
MSKLLFTLAVLSVSAPLAASERDIPHPARIPYADLDLTRDAGKAELDRRIKATLNALCAEDQQLGLSKRLQEIRCLRAATAQVAAKRAQLLANAAARSASQDTALITPPRRPISSAD